MTSASTWDVRLGSALICCLLKKSVWWKRLSAIIPSSLRVVDLFCQVLGVGFEVEDLDGTCGAWASCQRIRFSFG